MALFMRRATDPEVVDAPTATEAYREGRRDERRVEPVRDREVVASRVDRAEIDEAYARGRREERLRHRGSPLLTLLILIVVLIGGTMIYLAIRNGSFSSGGAVVDQNLSRVSQSAQAPIKGAADKAGDALQNAGQNLKQSAGNGAP